MHLGDVISVDEQKSLLSLQGPSAAKEAERKSLAVKQWCFQCFFSLFTQTFGKEQGSWLSDASTAPMYKMEVTWHMTTITASCLPACRNWKAQIRLYYAV